MGMAREVNLAFGKLLMKLGAKEKARRYLHRTASNVDIEFKEQMNKICRRKSQPIVQLFRSFIG